MKLISVLLLAGTAWAGACTDTAKCTEWVTLGGGPWRSRIYTTYSLNTPNPAITRAFILIHGTGRDADNYFRTATASAFLGGALTNTVVISPRFASNEGNACR